MPAKKSSVTIYFLTGSVAFIVYLLTLAPDLTWANFGVDGGELVTAVYTLGVPHPSGYPTYILLGKLFSFLPIGSVAYRMNLFSAVSVAAAAGFVAATTKRLSVISHQLSVISKQSYPHTDNCSLLTDYCPLVAGLTFAFAPLVWGQATITEVYGLNLAFLAAFLWALLQKFTAKDANDAKIFPLSSSRPSRSLRLINWRWHLLTGFLLGLSITTHLTSLLMLPLGLALTPRREWVYLGLGLLAGLAPFLAIPWLAQTGSPVVWGDPTTLDGWWWLVSGRLYRSNVLGLPLLDIGLRLKEWAVVLLRQFAGAGWLLIILGFYESANGVEALAGRPLVEDRLKPRLHSKMLATAVFYIIYALSYSSADAIVFVLPGLLILSILLAPGLRRLGWAALLLPLALLLLNFNWQNLSDDREIRPRAEQLLQTAAEEAILLTPGDRTIFTLWYYQHVEGQRPDLILVDSNLFAFDWYRQRLQMLYPDLGGLADDDLEGFQQYNQQKRPYCLISMTSLTPITDSCFGSPEIRAVDKQ